MLDIALCIVAVIAGGLALEAFAASKAPMGYQDRLGFHFGSEPRSNSDDFQGGNPS